MEKKGEYLQAILVGSLLGIRPKSRKEENEHEEKPFWRYIQVGGFGEISRGKSNMS